MNTTHLVVRVLEKIITKIDSHDHLQRSEHRQSVTYTTGNIEGMQVSLETYNPSENILSFQLGDKQKLTVCTLQNKVWITNKDGYSISLTYTEELENLVSNIGNKLKYRYDSMELSGFCTNLTRWLDD
jgi:hypothetical protein